ncbi:MAG: response regulator [Ahniella sp.]|nr:response regulator [Ahniella sp.]
MILSQAEIQAANILIVDDQEANVQLLEQLLKDAGYQCVSSTRDPTEVCSLHRRNRYDLILLDLQMPGMDGFEVMAGLATDTGESYLPVIVLTAQPGHKLRALKSGAKDFLSKPFDLIEVKTRIHNMLEVRLLYRKLEAHQAELEKLVEERTAQLRESEARFKSLTHLAADWYWEQDEAGAFTRVSGPVIDMLGIVVDPLVGTQSNEDSLGWDETERAHLRASIEARKPFLDFVLSRTLPNGTQKRYRVSGEPMFGQACRYIGYRGVGAQILE